MEQRPQKKSKRASVENALTFAKTKLSQKAYAELRKVENTEGKLTKHVFHRRTASDGCYVKFPYVKNIDLQTLVSRVKFYRPPEPVTYPFKECKKAKKISLRFLIENSKSRAIIGQYNVLYEDQYTEEATEAEIVILNDTIIFLEDIQTLLRKPIRADRFILLDNYSSTEICGIILDDFDLCRNYCILKATTQFDLLRIYRTLRTVCPNEEDKSYGLALQ